MTAEQIVTEIYRHKFHYRDEKELQKGISILLSQLGLEFYPEVPLSRLDRIDFLVADGIGIEVKINSPLTPVIRQLWRYSECPEIQALILVTTRSKHMNLPVKMNGKPLYYVYLLYSVF